MYVEGAFAGAFNVAFDASLARQAGNHSWSTLSILLLGGPPPSDSISVGLYPKGSGIGTFTFVTRGRTTAFRPQSASCRTVCRLALQGDRWSIAALVDGRVVARWPRFGFRLPHPSLQLNGEVAAPGDRLDGRLTPIELHANRRALEHPSCSFTTRGIVARQVGGWLHFQGVYDPNAGSFYTTLDGRRLGESCGR